MNTEADNLSSFRLKKRDIFCFLGGLLLLFLWVFSVLGMESDQSYNGVTVKYSGQTYIGNYQGEWKNNKPNGKGIFVSEDGTFRYEGDWKKGRVTGKGIVVLPDGTQEEGNFLNGRKNGFCRILSPESTSKEALFRKGKSYGNVSIFENGELVSRELFINGTALTDIKEKAVTLTQELIESRAYLNQYVFVEGTVKYVQQTEDMEYFRIHSNALGEIVASFENAFLNEQNQVYLPNLVPGDKLSLWGYYAGYKKDTMEEDEDFFGFQCIRIDPFYGEVINSSYKEDSYNKLAKNPYSYLGISFTQEFEIEKCVKKGSQYYVFAHEKKKTADQVVISLTSKNNTVFLPGMVLSGKGFYSGQYKLAYYIEDRGEEETLYHCYPLLNMEEWSFAQ